MADDIVLLVLGFLLTSVVGGALGYVFQKRAWENQNRLRLLEAEHAAAATACMELSTLLDKRLYRMRQLDDVLSANSDVEPHAERYRDVLYEWNDALNRNLARTRSYFGSEAKTELERIYESVSEIHGDLRRRLDAQRRGEHGADGQGAALDRLSDQIYDFSARMNDLLRDDRVGRRNPDYERPG